MRFSFTMTLLAGAIFFAAGCGGPSDEPGGARTFRPIDAASADFWDRQTTENAALLREMAAEFNAGHSGLPVKIVQSGNYGDIYTKTVASIQAGALPSMAVAYGNMTVEYAAAGAVVDLDELMADAEVGLGAEELDDFFPAVLEQNRYEAFGGRTLSFPYTKAVLVLYFNTRVMAEAGLGEAPKTWDAFLEQCRKIKRETGKHALSFDVDASTINGMIFSMGGDILEGDSPDRKVQYNTPETLAVFELLEKLFAEELAYQNPPRSFDDQTAFGQDEIAFALRPSSSLPYFNLVMEGNEGWGVAPLPQADPQNPATVLYGANLSIFNTTPEHIRSAWAFAKYFTSPEVNVRWALRTGYLPYRKSAVSHPDLQAFWGEWEYNRVAFDCLGFARPEPNLEGWQQVRSKVEDAATRVVTGMDSGHNSVVDLQRNIDRWQAP